VTPAVKISKQLQAIAAELDARLEGVAGERVAFTLVVFTDGRANYVSTASREDSVHNLRQLLGQWETDAPDTPVHHLD
jgi:hypothetical protein